MKLAIVGTGRMGQAVERLAGERGHEIIARFNSEHPLPDDDQASALQGIEVVIDFSLPDVAVEHITRYSRWNQHAVIGTTGWYDEMEAVQKAVDASEAGILYAPNFSMGVALLARALQTLMPLLEHLPDYDAALHETHHTGKVDSPSGTALLLANIVLDGLSRKTRLDTETQHQRIDPEALHVTSARLGHVIGTHTLHFDSPFDELTLTHRAKNREGFAYGAITAAEWLPGRHGLFTLDDMLADWLPE